MQFDGTFKVKVALNFNEHNNMKGYWVFENIIVTFVD